MECGKKYDLEYVVAQEGVPHCEKCGGIVRPDIVLYEENLNHKDVDDAIKAVKKCDLLIIAGTSLTVYPAATFAQFLKHDRIVIINKSSTYMDLKALLTIHDNVGDVLDNCVPKRVSRAKNAGTRSKKTAASKTKTAAKKTTAKKTAAKTKTETKAKTTAKASTAKTSAKKAPAKKPAAKSKSAGKVNDG
jgi:NAD-dependent deacetylase